MRIYETIRNRLHEFIAKNPLSTYITLQDSSKPDLWSPVCDCWVGRYCRHSTRSKICARYSRELARALNLPQKRWCLILLYPNQLAGAERLATIWRVKTVVHWYCVARRLHFLSQSSRWIYCTEHYSLNRLPFASFRGECKLEGFLYSAFQNTHTSSVCHRLRHRT